VKIHLAAEPVSTAAFFTTPSTTQNASAINHQIKMPTIVLPRFFIVQHAHRHFNNFPHLPWLAGKPNDPTFHLF